ncbi:MAG: hypothetical protein ACRDTM_12675 [Micromonosporaceae bacterium]
MTRPEIAAANGADPEEWEPRDAGTERLVDAPEADAAEQSRSLREDDEGPVTSVNPEVNEADAVEQSQVVVEDDEYDR